MAIEDTLRELRTSISQAQSRKARAAVELDNAKERLKASQATLRDEFGVATTDDARTKLTALQGELDAAVAEVEKQLAEAGA